MADQKREKAQLLQEGLLRPVDLLTGVLPQAEAPLLAAIDLGSTSIVLYLHDAFTGEQLGVQSTLNPQRQYGGDVVQRANTAMEQGPEVLSSCVRAAIDGLLNELPQKIGRKPEDVVRVAKQMESVGTDMIGMMTGMSYEGVEAGQIPAVLKERLCAMVESVKVPTLGEGGINLTNYRAFKETGVNILVIGTSIDKMVEKACKDVVNDFLNVY